MDALGSPPNQPADLLPQLETIEGYRRYFMDLASWRPHVQTVCRRHDGLTGREVRPGLAGTYPTFIVDDRWVVKFYGRLFDGALGFETERDVGALLASTPEIPAPAILASGDLCPGSSAWPWPYLIFEFIPGVSIGEVYEQVSLDDKLALARYLGEVTGRLHRLPVAGSTVFRPSWDTYLDLLRAQRARCAATHRGWGTLPEPLIEQIESYALPAEALVDPDTPPYLIHADLTRDHILGRLCGGRWTTSAIIDFGDAMVGNLYYELSALHLDLFGCDKRLLRAYLDAYGVDERTRQGLPARAMSAALLHRFGVLSGAFESRPDARGAETLDDLATLLWDVDV